MKRLLTILMMLCFIGITKAQQSKDSITIDDFYVDFAVPDIGAFNLLSLGTDAIVRPGNLKEFGVALSSLGNTAGDLTPGIGIEYAPLMSIAKKDRSFWSNKFRWQNLAITIATNKVDSLGTRLAYGFKWVPFDDADPLTDKAFQNQITEYLKVFNGGTSADKKDKYLQELVNMLTSVGLVNREIVHLYGIIDITDFTYKDSLRKRLAKGSIPNYRKFLTDTLQTSATYAKLSQEQMKQYDQYIDLFINSLISEQSIGSYLKEIIQKKKEEYKRNKWNAMALQISGGWVRNSETSTYEDLKQENAAVLASFAAPLKINKWFSAHSQLILQAKYNSDKSQITPERERTSLGGRLLFGNADNRLSIETLYSDTSLDNQLGNIKFLRWSVGTEIKLSTGSWLEIAFGGIRDLDGDNTEMLPSFGIKHAFLNKRRFNTN